MHADDDDAYTPDAFAVLRERCVDVHTLYIAQFQIGTSTWIRPQMDAIVEQHIGTPCGIVPFDAATKSIWAPYVGGDFRYYKGLETIVPEVRFIKHVIQIIRPE